MSAIKSPMLPWRSVGVWMSALIMAMMFVNAVRAISDPKGFAAYYGLAGSADGDPAFVYVYASRAFFLAAATAVFLVAKQWRALMLFALAAIVMPVCDALQVAIAQGQPMVVARHLAIAVYLALTAFFLNRLISRSA
jgi:Domain of unknown function (DUF4267)